MAGVSNSNLLIDFDLTTGIAVRRIFDVVAARDYLLTESLFFEFAVNNGPCIQSDTGVSATVESEAADGSAVSILARSNDDRIGFGLSATLAPGSAAALFELTAVNLTSAPILLRVMLPKIRGIRTPGDPANMMGMIPQEAGSVAPLSTANAWGTPAIPLGMQFNLDIRLPIARNNMEVASVFDCSTGGGVFFCDMDGDLDNGIAPIQFNLSSLEVVGFWIGEIAGNTSVKLPRFAIGVHSEGDWHNAVDYYTAVHRPRWTFPNTPAWFRETPAIYTPAGGGAGGIYLAQTPATLADGAVWNAWRVGSSDWNSGPVQVSPGGFTPTGSLLQAINQNSQQVTVFAAGFDGAIWATWESGDGPWHNNRNNLVPSTIAPPGWVTPGIPLACAQQGSEQWDVFFTRPDGSLWVTWEVSDGTWTDGRDGRRFPSQIAPPGSVPPGAHITAAKQNDNLLDLFCIGTDGAIWVWFVAGLGEWSKGTAITTAEDPALKFPPGAPLVAIKQNDSQLDVFAVDVSGTVRVTWEASDSAWQAKPVPVSPSGLVPAGAFLAAAKQTSSQLDVFFVGNDGAIWVTWEENDWLWTDGNGGRLPKQITPAQLASPGAPLAVAAQGEDQLHVFVVGADYAISVTSEQGNGPWTDRQQGRPGPQKVAGFLALPSSGIAALARNDSQIDVFCTVPGRIKSFLDLPNLLKEANSLGTNVLYLMDYWEGTDQGGDPPYFNKGDYLPRSDLGGELAFIEGISLVHQCGGRVLLYLEPFIIYRYSMIGLANGVAWGGRDTNGKLFGIDLPVLPDYPDNYSMVAPFQAWQDYIVQIAQRLVGQYGADGIMLDSYGWQMNRPMHNNAENVFYSAQDYSKGVLDLVDRVRSAMQQINPNAVVIGETTAGPIARHWDGGLNADLGFDNLWGSTNKLQNLTASPIPQRLIASPVRYGIPEVRMFGNGLNLGGLHQIFAAGHGLALCSNFPGGGFMFDNAAHIQKLLGIRATYRDALITGAQINQPPSNNPVIVAYQYQGSTHRMITIVNISDGNAAANISLNTPDPGGLWKDLLSGRTFSTTSGVFENVTLTTGVGSLLVLLNTYSPIRSEPVGRGFA